MISQTKNSATDSTQENFSTVHGLMWRSCSWARRGPRVRGARALPAAGPPACGAGRAGAVGAALRAGPAAGTAGDSDVVVVSALPA